MAIPVDGMHRTGMHSCLQPYRWKVHANKRNWPRGWGVSVSAVPSLNLPLKRWVVSVTLRNFFLKTGAVSTYWKNGHDIRTPMKGHKSFRTLLNYFLFERTSLTVNDSCTAERQTLSGWARISTARRSRLFCYVKSALVDDNRSLHTPPAGQQSAAEPEDQNHYASFTPTKSENDNCKCLPN